MLRSGYPWRFLPKDFPPRSAEGRNTSPSAGIIDFQSVKTTDTGGLLVTVQVHGPNVQDHDGTPVVLASIRHTFPRLRHVFADQAYSDPKLTAALKPLGR